MNATKGKFEFENSIRRNYGLSMDSNLPLKGILGVEMECRFGDVFGAVIQTSAKREFTTMETN